MLVVKLDALGDVLRTGGLLPAIRARHNRPRVTWLTRPGPAADLVTMMPLVDDLITLTPEGLAQVQAVPWHTIYSLSNDMESASLAHLGRAQEVVGFYVNSYGNLTPSNLAARMWLEMACFDQYKKANRQSWYWHMLQIIGGGQLTPPQLSLREVRREEGLVAVNVGAGKRWPKKMLGPRQIADLTKSLRQLGARVLLVGGEAERDLMEEIGWEVEAERAITKTVRKFVETLQRASVLICGDTLALHVASAVALPTIVVCGPTSLYEIETFGGLVTRFASDLDCLCCYGDCNKEENCMTKLDVKLLASAAVEKLERSLQNA